MFTKETTERLQQLETPFYYYDLDLLRETLAVASGEALPTGDLSCIMP